MEIDILYRMAGGEGRVIVNNPKTGKLEADQKKTLREKAVPDQLKKFSYTRKSESRYLLF